MAVKALPCPTLLRLLLDYNPEAGTLTWKPRAQWLSTNRTSHCSWNAKNASKKALKCLRKDGYLHGAIFGRLTLAHRVAWCISTGRWPVAFIDHVNGDRSDNRMVNLRAATFKQNIQNSRNRKTAASKFKGVHRDKRFWRSSIMVDGKRTYLGSYKTEIEAANAYDAAARKHVGAFAKLNMP